MGVGLAVAVLLDATLIRGVLLPASMTLLGERNWWLPRSLELAAAGRSPSGRWCPPRADPRHHESHRAPAFRRAPALSSARTGLARGYARVDGPARPTRWSAARTSSRRSIARSTGSTRGRLSCLTIEGEPGIGKTRLLAELRRRCRGTRPSRPPGRRIGVRDLPALRDRRRRLRRLPRLARRRSPATGPPSFEPSSARIFPSLRGESELQSGDQRRRALPRPSRDAQPDRAAGRRPRRWSSSWTTSTGPTTPRSS